MRQAKILKVQVAGQVPNFVARVGHMPESAPSDLAKAMVLIASSRPLMRSAPMPIATAARHETIEELSNLKQIPSAQRRPRAAS